MALVNSTAAGAPFPGNLLVSASYFRLKGNKGKACFVLGVLHMVSAVLSITKDFSSW